MTKITQRAIASVTGLSLGKVNTLIKDLRLDGSHGLDPIDAACVLVHVGKQADARAEAARSELINGAEDLFELSAQQAALTEQVAMILSAGIAMGRFAATRPVRNFLAVAETAPKPPGPEVSAFSPAGRAFMAKASHPSARSAFQLAAEALNSVVGKA